MAIEKKRLIIIDSNSIIHRAYHALPPLATKKGELVNAVYGFILVFLKTIKDFNPDFIAACFDFPGLTFRHKKFKKYKAKRPPTPKELCQQIPKVKKVLKSFNTPIFEKQGFEADDIIGTIARLAAKKQILPEIEIIILSGDSDLFQLVDAQTKVCILRKGVKDVFLYDEKEVREKFKGLNPRQILDFKALRGDPSDNIPGVTGIGEKTAIELLLNFDNLENIYKKNEADSEKTNKIKPKLKEILLKYKEQAFLSKNLAQIKKDVPIEFDFKNCQWQDYNRNEAKELFEKFEFFSLTKRLPEKEKKEEKEQIGENLKLW